MEGRREGEREGREGGRYVVGAKGGGREICGRRVI